MFLSIFAYILLFYVIFVLYKFGLWKKILDLVLEEILDLVLLKEHTNKSGPEPFTGNGRDFEAWFFPREMGGTYINPKIWLQYLLAGVVFDCVHFAR